MKGRILTMGIIIMSIANLVFTQPAVAQCTKKVCPREPAKKCEHKYDKTQMEPIYKAIKINNARILSKGPFSLGDKIIIAYELKNISGKKLEVPESHPYYCGKHLIGIRQHWIEQEEIKSEIPAISNIGLSRRGRRYAAGARAIEKDRIEAGETLEFKRTIDTTGYTPGEYTYYIEYKAINEYRVLQTEKVSFKLR